MKEVKYLEDPQYPDMSWRERMIIIYYYVAIYTPVVFLQSIYLFVFCLYHALYIIPLIATLDDRPKTYFWKTDEEHDRAQIRGCILWGIMSWCYVMLFIASLRAWQTSPGGVPQNSDWAMVDEPDNDSLNLLEPHWEREPLLKQFERTTKGTIRTCERCCHRKPDRTHHCRLCDSCVLKMDHHCPWIANWVGYYNYKFFFLMIFYGSVCLNIFTSTFWEAVYVNFHDPERDAYFCFFVVFSYSLLSLLTFIVFCFCLFHIYLLANNYTTIEYWEKKRQGNSVYQRSPYKTTLYTSLQSAFGPSPLLWLIPVQTKKQNEGMSFDFVHQEMQTQIKFNMENSNNQETNNKLILRIRPPTVTFETEKRKPTPVVVQTRSISTPKQSYKRIQKVPSTKVPIKTIGYVVPSIEIPIDDNLPRIQKSRRKFWPLGVNLAHLHRRMDSPLRMQNQREFSREGKRSVSPQLNNQHLLRTHTRSQTPIEYIRKRPINTQLSRK